METLAQEWIDEGKSIGFDLGKKEGIDIGKKEGIAQGLGQGIAAQRQTLLHLLQWRFPLAPAAQQTYAQQVARIDNLDHLLQLVNQLLTSQDTTDFDKAFLSYLPPEPGKP